MYTAGCMMQHSKEIQSIHGSTLTMAYWLIERKSYSVATIILCGLAPLASEFHQVSLENESVCLNVIICLNKRKIERSPMQL